MWDFDIVSGSVQFSLVRLNDNNDSITSSVPSDVKASFFSEVLLKLQNARSLCTFNQTERESLIKNLLQKHSNGVYFSPYQHTKLSTV